MKEGLERAGHRVTIFTGLAAPPVGGANIHVVRDSRASRPLLDRLAGILRSPAYWSFGFGKAIASAMSDVHRRDPIDVIEMEESFGWFDDVRRNCGVPLIVKLHGPAFLSLIPQELDTHFGREKVLREGKALQSANAIIAPSRVTLELTIARYQLSPQLTAQVVNPIGGAEKVPVWSLMSCERDTALFVGRFDLRKGADVVLRAFALLRASGRRVRLIFVGHDNGVVDKRGRLLKFEEYCGEYLPSGIRADIDFYGSLSNDEVARLRMQALVTVVASRWENQSYTQLEAMLQGCPIISTNAGGSAEVVSSGVTGLLATSEDPDDLARQLIRLFDDPIYAARLGAAARQRVLTTHSPAFVVDRTLSAYECAIKAVAKSE
jgi:glycosyltransferase involved in cell wall biosynthesis